MPKTSATPTILFVHNAPSSFVKTDRHLLQQKWQTIEWYQRSRHIQAAALWQLVNRCDLVFCWFAGWHSLVPVGLARLLGKPALVVTGGYDVANLPEAGYGSQRGGLRRLIAQSVLNNATHLAAFSRSAKQETIYNAQIAPEKISVIPLAVQPLAAGPLTGRDNMALTVGGVWRENFLRKGLLPFTQAAAHLAETKFTLAGQWFDDGINELRKIAPPNIEFPGFVTNAQLGKLYRQASVYVQASLHEGFGLSVAEAMLAGCIPVVTRQGALPEVVGEAGLYLNSTEPGEIAEVIRQALRSTSAKRQQARERILNQFPPEQRRRQLQSLVSQYLPGNTAAISLKALSFKNPA